MNRPKNRPKNQHAVALGRLGGKKGGLARKRALSSKKRSEIARKAARARWGKHKKRVIEVREQVALETEDQAFHDE